MERSAWTIVNELLDRGSWEDDKNDNNELLPEESCKWEDLDNHNVLDDGGGDEDRFMGIGMQAAARKIHI